MSTHNDEPKPPKIPNDCEKPPIIFDALALGYHERVKEFRRYFKDGPVIPLTHYFPPDSNEAVERSPAVMRVLWDAYYETLKPK